jgi:hypothetical protein
MENKRKQKRGSKNYEYIGIEHPPKPFTVVIKEDRD